MDITKFDKNFAAATVEKDGKKRFFLPCAPFKLYGGLYEAGTGFVRMPLDVAAGVSEGVHFLAANGAGLRLNFTTNSKTLRLYVRESYFCRMRHMALTGSSGFILCSREGAEKKSVFRGVLCPEWNFGDEFEVAVNLDGELRDYVLHFPLYSSVASLAIELDGDAYLGEGTGYKGVPPVLYYGSSITQGGCASRADNSYEDLICERTGVDYINLGFSGSGKAEDNMADYLRGVDCSVFVCDYDYNAPTPEYLAATHERLYKRYREGKKDTPIVFVTRPESSCVNDDANKRAEIIYATYEKALKKGDENVYFVDGRGFFPAELKQRCLVDGCHPTDLGFYFMADKIGGVVENILHKRRIKEVD